MINKLIKIEIENFMFEELFHKFQIFPAMYWNQRENRKAALNTLLGYVSCLNHNKLINNDEYQELRSKIYLCYPDQILPAI